MPEVRDARVRKRESSETFSRSRYTAFSRSRAAGRLSAEAARQGGPAGRLSCTLEGPNEAIAEFTTVGYPMRTERQRDQGPRSGRVSQKVSSESADQVVVDYRTGAGPATTQSSRVLHSSAGVTTDSHDAVNYHKMELEEQTRREVAHESDATRTMTTRKSQSGEKKPTSVGDTHEPKPRIGTKEEVCNACLQRKTVTRSQPATGERETVHQSVRR